MPTQPGGNGIKAGWFFSRRASRVADLDFSSRTSSLQCQSLTMKFFATFAVLAGAVLSAIAIPAAEPAELVDRDDHILEKRDNSIYVCQGTYVTSLRSLHAFGADADTSSKETGTMAAGAITLPGTNASHGPLLASLALAPGALHQVGIPPSSHLAAEHLTLIDPLQACIASCTMGIAARMTRRPTPSLGLGLPLFRAFGSTILIPSSAGGRLPPR